MKIILMCFGSRGDIQPFLALALALQNRGHEVTLAAPVDFAETAQSYNVPYLNIPLSTKFFMEMDFAKRMTEDGINPRTVYGLVREGLPALGKALEATCHIVAEAAKNADLLVSHGFLGGFGYSIHQAIKIPLLLGIAAPVVETKAFPSPMFPPIPFGQNVYNPATYDWLVRFVVSFMTNPMNKYRQSVGLPKLSTGEVVRLLTKAKLPLMMHYSRHLMPRPADWNENAHVLGQWSLPAPKDWTAPEKLRAFLEAGETPVYIGFGSMPVQKPEKMAKTISEALRLAKRRGILQAGWAGLNYEDEHLITIGDTPHDWLFPRMAAIVHHGGSGTTHSALSAGKPSLIVPFSADQPFWGRRLAELGVNVAPIVPRQIKVENLAEAIRKLTDDSTMQKRAAELGALLRAENGVEATCELIEVKVKS
jgi:sterol 3beta-glucosyltransferase